jgi:membrane protein YqaA with SNARE-associated domain
MRRRTLDRFVAKALAVAVLGGISGYGLWDNARSKASEAASMTVDEYTAGFEDFHEQQARKAARSALPFVPGVVLILACGVVLYEVLGFGLAALLGRRSHAAAKSLAHERSQ